MTLVVEYYLGSSNGVRLLVLFRIRRNKCSQPVRIAVTSFHVYSDSYVRCYSVRCLRANESLTVNLRSLYSAKVHVTPVRLDAVCLHYIVCCDTHYVKNLL